MKDIRRKGLGRFLTTNSLAYFVYINVCRSEHYWAVRTSDGKEFQMLTTSNE